MTRFRRFTSATLLVLSISLRSLLLGSTAHAQDIEEVPSPPLDETPPTRALDEEVPRSPGGDAPIPEGDDVRGPLLVGAAFSTGFFAFNLALELAQIPEFGPRPVVTASLAVTSLGWIASHIGALALLDPSIYADPRQRSFFAGLSLLGTSLGLLGLAVPSCFAVTSAPLDGGPEDIGVVAPFFLGGMGLVGIIAGAVMMNDALSLPNDVSIDLAASPDGAMVAFRGTF